MTTYGEAYKRCVALQREGEAAGLTFAPLGRYVAERMTPGELRALFREYARMRAKHPTLGDQP